MTSIPKPSITKLIAIGATALMTLSLHGQTGNEKAIELSLFHPIQLHDENTDIRGLRLNVFYAKNNNLTGVDLGIFGLGQNSGDVAGIQWNFIGSVVDGDMVGWQTGIYSHTKGEFTGLKAGLVNLQDGEMVGWQYGFVSIAHDKVTGLQTGLYNRAADMKGLQLGFINVADQLHGIQLGLVNFNLSGDPLYVFPFVNFSF